MELPHLTLAVRRFWRTPGRLTVVFLLFWLIVVGLESLRPGWIYTVLTELPVSAQFDLTALVYLTIGALGYFAVYYVIAANMRHIADRVSGGHWGWYATTLTGSEVLSGILLGTLSAAVVPLTGLLAYISVRTAFIQHSYGNDVPIGFQFGFDGFNVPTFVLFFLLRLPHFALVSGILHLAFRQIRYAASLPALLACSATVIHFWEGRYLYDAALHPQLLRTSPTTWLAIGLAGTVGLALCMLLASRTGRFSLWQVILASALLVVPLCAGTASFYTDVVFHKVWRHQGLHFVPVSLPACTYSRFALPAHAILGNVFPGEETVFYDRNTAGTDYSRWQGAIYSSCERCDHWYGVPGQHGLHLLLATLGYLTSLALWWVVAIACLQLARFPGRPLFRLPSRAGPRD